jgi:polar amino acid transport system substrate-binding protein
VDAIETRARSVLDEILERGVIRIAVTWSPPPETGFPPEFWLDEAGEPQGIAIEIGKILAADLGVRPEWVNVPWGEQFAALAQGDVDLLPKPTLTPARALEMEFSDRLMAFEVVVITRRNSGLTLDDLRQRKLRISTWEGSSCNAIVLRMFPAAEVVEFLDENEAKRAVSEEHVDAIVTDAVTKVSMTQLPDLDFVREPSGDKVVLAREYGHFAVRVGDQRMLNFLNSWISYRRADGVLDHWCETWWLSWMAH